MSQTVLVADDSKTIRQIVEMALKASPWEVVGVDTAQQAMQAARQRPTVILLDYYMPDGSGYDVCRALKEDAATRQIPIVMLGGTYQSFDESRARACGADVVLMKPFKTDALLNALEDAKNAESSLPLPSSDPITTESSPEGTRGYQDGPDLTLDEDSEPENQRLSPPDLTVEEPAETPYGYGFDESSGVDDLPQPGSFRRPTHTPMPTPPTPPAAPTPMPPTPTPVPPARARGLSSPSIQPATAAPTVAPTANDAISKEEIEAMIQAQVKAAVKNELPGLLRNVMAEIFQQKIMPKLTEHADARIQQTLNTQLSVQIQQQVRTEINRLLDEE